MEYDFDPNDPRNPYYTGADAAPQPATGVGSGEATTAVGSLRNGPNGTMEIWNGTAWVTAPPNPLFGPGTNIKPGVDIPLANPVTAARPSTTAAQPPSANPLTNPQSVTDPYQTTPFDWPQFTPPDFVPQVGIKAPNPYTFTPFNYKDFSAPTLEDAKNQPGYLFGLQQGQDALQNSAAARGTLRGGGTLKDLFGYTNAAAEQNYGNVFNQQKGVYDENRNNAFGTWAANTGAGLDAYNTNWGVARDVNNSLNGANQMNYEDAYKNATGAFDPKFKAATYTFNDAYQRWLAKLNSLTTIATSGGA